MGGSYSVTFSKFAAGQEKLAAVGPWAVVWTPWSSDSMTNLFQYFHEFLFERLYIQNPLT